MHPLYLAADMIVRTARKSEIDALARAVDEVACAIDIRASELPEDLEIDSAL